jgi:YD repeat-containing protein
MILRLVRGSALIVFAANFVLLPLPLAAESGYYSVTLNTNTIGTGSSRTDACSNVVEAHPQRCDEWVSGPSGGWYCNFRYTQAPTVCTPCEGFFCNFGHGRIKSKTCSPPKIFNPITLECKEPKPDPCDGIGPNPVGFTTGNKSINEQDFSSTNDLGLKFTRSWQSQYRQWVFSYRQHLSRLSEFPYYVTVQRESGQESQFGEEGGVWSTLPISRDTLTPAGLGWLYTLSSGEKQWFDSDGNLTRILRADGSGVTVLYPDENTVEVKDDYVNEIVLTLDSDGKVITMVDPDGASYKYGYLGDNLQYVGYPDDTPGTTGPNPFGEDNPFRAYHYTGELVTAISDENGVLYKTITYDDDGRADSSGLSDGSIGNNTYDYTNLTDTADPRVTETNPLGKSTVYHMSEHHGVFLVREVEGNAHVSTGCLADVRSKTYYPEGWLQSSFDKAGNETYYEYYTDTDRYGLTSKRVEGKNSTQARTFEFDWYSGSRLQKQEKLLGVKQTDYTYYANGKLHTHTETDLTGLADVATRTWTSTYSYHDPGTDTQVATISVDGPRLPPVTDITTTYYSRQGYKIRVTNALNQDTEYRFHNGRGQPQEIEDPNGIITSLEYHPRGWLDKITQDVGGRNAVTDLHYDKVGQLTGVTLADGVYTEF